MKPSPIRLALLIPFVSAVGGCTTSAGPGSPLPSLLPQQASTPPIDGSIVPNADIAVPSVRKAYFVGALHDPRHPDLMYHPGVVYREELPERWNTNPRAHRGARAGVLSGVPDAAMLPGTDAETQQLVAQQQSLMQLLAANNADLAARVRELEEAQDSGAASATPVVAPVAGAVSLPPPDPAAAPSFIPPPTPPTPRDLSRAIVPNGDGVIELSPQLLDPFETAEPNPFVVRYQAQTVYRDIPVEVTAIVPGPRPSASVNGRILNTGDAWDVFTIAVITRDAVYLEKGQFLLMVPIARERAVTIRLPQ